MRHVSLPKGIMVQLQCDDHGVPVHAVVVERDAHQPGWGRMSLVLPNDDELDVSVWGPSIPGILQSPTKYLAASLHAHAALASAMERVKQSREYRRHEKRQEKNRKGLRAGD